MPWKEFWISSHGQGRTNILKISFVRRNEGPNGSLWGQMQSQLWKNLAPLGRECSINQNLLHSTHLSINLASHLDSGFLMPPLFSLLPSWNPLVPSVVLNVCSGILFCVFGIKKRCILWLLFSEDYLLSLSFIFYQKFHLELKVSETVSLGGNNVLTTVLFFF